MRIAVFIGIDVRIFKHIRSCGIVSVGEGISVGINSCAFNGLFFAGDCGVICAVGSYGNVKRHARGYLFRCGNGRIFNPAVNIREQCRIRTRAAGIFDKLRAEIVNHNIVAVVKNYIVQLVLRHYICAVDSAEHFAVYISIEDIVFSVVTIEGSACRLHCVNRSAVCRNCKHHIGNRSFVILPSGICAGSVNKGEMYGDVFLAVRKAVARFYKRSYGAFKHIGVIAAQIIIRYIGFSCCNGCFAGFFKLFKAFRGIIRSLHLFWVKFFQEIVKLAVFECKFALGFVAVFVILYIQKLACYRKLGFQLGKLFFS